MIQMTVSICLARSLAIALLVAGTLNGLNAVSAAEYSWHFAATAELEWALGLWLVSGCMPFRSFREATVL